MPNELPPCQKHCNVCEGMDHHWLLEATDEEPEGFAACKHCSVKREIRDSDFDEFP